MPAISAAHRPPNACYSRRYRIKPCALYLSAGFTALSGHAADASAAAVALQHGLSLEGHSAQQLTRALCQQHDLILVMEQKHIDAVARIAPEVRGKTMRYGHWLQRDIPDPYRQSQEAFEFTFNLIADATQSWVQRLNK